MTADPEAVTRALAEHTILRYSTTRGDKVFCRHGEWLSIRDYNAHLASVLASLPDDRLAEAWSRGLVSGHSWHSSEPLCLMQLNENPYESRDEKTRRREALRAALSGGDAT